MKKLVFIFSFVSCVFLLKAQDTIFMKNNTNIVLCKITKVTSMTIFYTENKVGKSIELKEVSRYSKPAGTLSGTNVQPIITPDIKTETKQKSPEKDKPVTKKSKTDPYTNPDPSKYRRSKGLTLGVTFGLNRSVSNAPVYYYVDYNSKWNREFQVENKIGWRLSFNLGIIDRKKYELEIPIAINVERFNVPGISQYAGMGSDNFAFVPLEISFFNYFKFFQKHSVLVGPGLLTYDQFDFGDLSTYGLTLGYGYKIFRPLNVSLRYRLNLGRFETGDSFHVDSHAYKYSAGYLDEYSPGYSTIALCVTYDFLNPRKWKLIQEKKKRVKKDKYDDDYGNMYSSQPVIQVDTKPAIDYTKYTDTELQEALKKANSSSDLDAMLAIQKELDARKAQNEFSSMSNVQLEQALGKALDAEDYKRAELLKKEIAKRDAQKGIPSGNGTNDLEKKSIEELTKLKNEAVQKEDYEKAKQIQDIINKKKTK